jgi:hypothetical protein
MSPCMEMAENCVFAKDSTGGGKKMHSLPRWAQQTGIKKIKYYVEARSHMNINEWCCTEVVKSVNITFKEKKRKL